MPSKTLNRPSTKYESVKRAVSAAKPPEEPKIHPNHVVAAFHSFGFHPNQNGMNDVGYWSTRGQSEMPKLMEELRKRRLDINNKVEADKAEAEAKQKKLKADIESRQEATKTLPRLSDEQIRNLHDEYGLPSPDPEWVRNHMSNDPEKVRAILDMQRKTADDMLKKHLKNTVNSMPETPKGGQGGPSVTGSAMLPPNNNNLHPGAAGVGGPGYYGVGGPNDPQSPMKPFFVGDHALVRIANPLNPSSGTLWLVDSKNKTLHPIQSEKAFHSMFEDPEQAKASITTLSSQALSPGGPLDGFTPLTAQHAVQDDGTFNKPQFSPSQLQKRYGKAQDPGAEQKALTILDSVLGKIAQPLGNSGQMSPQNQAMNANS